MSEQTARYWRADGGYQDVPAASPAASTTAGPARYWRADGGYQDVPAPQAATPMMNQPMMMCFPNYPSCWPQGGYMQGPIGVGGLYSPPPPYASPAPPPQVPLPLAPPQGCKKEDNKDENLYAPPALPQGANYMFDRGENHTMLHIFNKAAPVWTEKYRTEKLKFKMFKVSTNFTVKMVIENTLKKKCGDQCEGWAATEVLERGDGQWDKGSTIEYDSDKAKGTLMSMGWSGKRGDSLPPVWLVVHKKDFK